MELQTIVLFGKRVTVDASMVGRLKAVERVWLEHGGHSGYRIDVIYGYADRNIAGTNTKSQHSHGYAVDINPSRNPMGSKLVTDMPDWFVQAFIDNGFGWGGNWKSKKDAMHFSLAKNEGGVGPTGGGKGKGGSGGAHQHGAEEMGVVEEVDVISEDEATATWRSLTGQKPTRENIAGFIGRPQDEYDDFRKRVSERPEARVYMAAKFFSDLGGGGDPSDMMRA